jgi:hypothetical protein
VLALFPIGTTVAKQFDGDDEQLVWFEGVGQRFDEGEDLCWVLYSDGDSEEMEESEVREEVWFEGVVQRFDEGEGLYWVLCSDGDSEEMQESEASDAVQNYRVHVQQQEEIIAEAETAATGSNVLRNGVDADVVAVPAAKDDALLTAEALVANVVQSSSNVDASETAVAIRAMTAAAERLASAATRIEAVVAVPIQQLYLQWRHNVQQQQQQQQLELLAISRSAIPFINRK